MRIGIPKALLYYRYGTLWRTFFEGLGCEVVLSGDTSLPVMEEGVRDSVGECCLPAKLFLGHVAALRGRCDLVFVPRCERTAKDEEFCVRFWGLPDIAAATYPGLPVLSGDLRGSGSAMDRHYLTIGHTLGKGRRETLHALRLAEAARRAADRKAQSAQQRELGAPGPKILLAAQPYIAHDPLLGRPLARMVRELGGVPVFADRCDRAACHRRSRELSRDLYWTMNREAVGAIPHLGGKIDGVILVTAFPCGTDCLVNELVLRRVRNVPITHLVLDEQQGEAGLMTRIECFLDIVRERGRAS